MTSSSAPESAISHALGSGAVLVTANQLTSVLCAYVSNNSVPIAELPKLIASVRDALSGKAGIDVEAGGNRPTPAQIKKSITHEALISFEDGKPYKTLRRHLTIKGLSPEAYRAKWGLPADYPMTAVAYSEQRSALAKSMGLGEQRRKDRAGTA